MIQVVNIEQMRERRGPFFEHWARRSVMAGHRKLVYAQRPVLDDKRESA